MSTNDGLRQQSVRTITGTAYDYNGDWHALFDLYGVTAGPIDGRMLAWLASKIGTVQTNLTDAKNAYAVAKGVDGWNSLGTFSPGALFAPLTDLATPLKAWWSAADHGTANMTDDGAGLISTWKDRLGGFSATATTTARATWAANAFNSSYAGLTFDGAANCYAMTTLTGLPVTTDPGWIFTVFNSSMAANSAGRAIVSYGTSGVGTTRRLMLTGSGASPTNAFRATDATANCTSVNGISDAQGNHIGFGSWSSTAIGATEDGTDITPVAAAPNTGSTRLRIGAIEATGASNFHLGVVRHLMIGSGTLSTSQLQQLFGWAAWDSNLTGLLPSSHPYKTVAP